MEIRLITAIIRASSLGHVEARLRSEYVSGITVCRAKGYGEYTDLIARDWMVGCVRVDILAEAHRADEIAEAIAEAAHTGMTGDGLVAILPVERVIRIRTQADADAESLR